MARILLVEDDHALAAGLVRGLAARGFEVELLTSGAEAAQRALTGKFALVVLDLMLPERSGFEVLAQLQHRAGPPVIVVTARSELADRLRSFDLGAVDYIAKPFWIEELVARIHARLGRSAPREPERVVSFGELSVDVGARTVTVGGEPVKLTRTELDLLVYLAHRPGRAVSRAQLAEHVLTGLDEPPDARTVDAHVTRIRKKLGPEGARIATVWGIGYRFEERP